MVKKVKVGGITPGDEESSDGNPEGAGPGDKIPAKTAPDDGETGADEDIESKEAANVDLDAETAAGMGLKCEQRMYTLSDLMLERVRLLTFNSWKLGECAETLAELGMFYTKKSNVVQCAFCGRYTTFDTDLEETTDSILHNLDCPFSSGQPTGNIPLNISSKSEASGSTSKSEASGSTSKSEASGSTSKSEASGSSSKRDARGIKRDARGAASKVSRKTASKDSEAMEMYKFLENYYFAKWNHERSRSTPKQPLITFTNSDKIFSSSEKNCIENRESTFDNWPIENLCSKVRMAEAGFIYAGVSDVVMCCYCGGGFYNWFAYEPLIVEKFPLTCNHPFLKFVKPKSLSTSSKPRRSWTFQEEEMELIMKHPISRVMLALVTSYEDVRTSLAKYIEKNGAMPATVGKGIAYMQGLGDEYDYQYGKSFGFLHAEEAVWRKMMKEAKEIKLRRTKNRFPFHQGFEIKFDVYVEQVQPLNLTVPRSSSDN